MLAVSYGIHSCSGLPSCLNTTTVELKNMPEISIGCLYSRIMLSSYVTKKRLVVILCTPEGFFWLSWTLLLDSASSRWIKLSDWTVCLSYSVIAFSANTPKSNYICRQFTRKACEQHTGLTWDYINKCQVTNVTWKIYAKMTYLIEQLNLVIWFYFALCHVNCVLKNILLKDFF